MTCNAVDEEDRRLVEDYVKLEGGGGGQWHAETSTSGCCGGDTGGGDEASSDGGWWLWSLWWWVKLVLVVLFVAVLGAVFFKWIGPFFMDKEIIPMINWVQSTFSTTILGLIVFASLAIFPVFLIPSTPSKWVAGMTFGYGYGFLLITAGVLIGSSIPYFIGSLFYHRIHAWLERHPKRASIIRLAGEGNWFSQFRAVSLIRISPFPYIIYNYCAVATDVRYVPYLLGTAVGMVPDIIVALYTGILIKTLANASQDGKPMPVSQMVINVAGFCITVSATVAVTWYAKRRLKELQMQEELLL
ncbi:TVP38/TMEM64 family membrane protein YtxB-like [Salvia splendens]|uniref:TVP38/TMEM64 family membrane protein YtxB-like n=1 Tax=Salvia splendens TaxID=180675 RepID=UPI001C266298|nr:TVP38/TMEM64 family membrane protein YtxB-like [Salvia splendens]